MDKLFIYLLIKFYRMWSKEKLFCDSFNKRSKYVKYKLRNYYTRNFQRPIVYPVLDYKYRYPEFSFYKMTDNFFMTNSNEKNEKNEEKIEEDDYNFNLDCPIFDDLVKEYHIKLFNQININDYIYLQAFNICLVKQSYHVKGTLFLFILEDRFKIIFFSNPYDFKSGDENAKKCNKKNDNTNKNKDKYQKSIENFCWGQLFKCPKKEYNRKIEIDSNDIRMILKKIYFYRESALELFTESKSYFFNFFSENSFSVFMSEIEKYISSSKDYLAKKSFYLMPIIINPQDKEKKRNIGYIKINEKFDENVKKSRKEKYRKYGFSYFISKSDGFNQICNFDLIIYMNLIANRSYIDLYQYPVFPVLFFCDKQNQILIRDLKLPIGFQDITQEAKKRSDDVFKNLIPDDNEKLIYFRIHYSSIIFASNFLIRLFPFSFGSIQLQGENFDDPNRSFYSVGCAFYSMLITQDIRELIPEFFYLPEMLMNINNINFGTLQNGDLMDDVVISDEIIKKELSSYQKVLCSSYKDAKENRKNILKSFIFIIKMKYYLENLTNEDLKCWLNLIFGQLQKYSSKKLQGQLFREESYISVYKETFKKNKPRYDTMVQVDTGLIPNQILLNEREVNRIKERKFVYDSNSNYEILNQKMINVLDDSKENPTKNYWDNNIKADFEKDNHYYGVGRFKVYNLINNKRILIDEIVDHSDKILNYFYNKRLNMFATCSLDGLICTYMFPNKLISIIKHPENLYFNEVFLSANPIPTIIAHEFGKKYLYSYSLNGMFINQIKYGDNNHKDRNESYNFNVKLYFDMYGGCNEDRIEIVCTSEKGEFIQREVFDLPFFNKLDLKVITPPEKIDYTLFRFK